MRCATARVWVRKPFIHALLVMLLATGAFHKISQAAAFDLLPFFCPDCVGEGSGERTLVGVECFYTYSATVKGKPGFYIVKSCNEPSVFEEFNYDDNFVYHLSDSSWATFENGQWNNARCFDGRPASSTYLNGAFGQANGACSGFVPHMSEEGGIWVPRHMDVGQQAGHPVTVVATAKEDCQCCAAQFTGPTFRVVKLVSRQEIDLGSGLGRKEVIRIAIMDGPGRGENFWYARNYGWIAFGHVEPPDAAKSLFEVNHIVGLDSLGSARQPTCPTSPAPEPIFSLTAGRVLDHDGVSVVAPPANTARNTAPVTPGEVREAERYWGLKGIDNAGTRQGGCDSDRVYLSGWHRGDLAEYLVRFAPGHHTLSVVGLPDDPQPVEVNVYVDGILRGQLEWNDGDPGCNETGSDDSHRIRIDGVSDDIHAVAFEFANDAYSCGDSYSEGCDRNLHFDYFTLEADAISPVPPPPPAPTPTAPTILNPDFEADGGFFGVASGWSAFGAHKWEAVWDPERVFTQGVTDVAPNGQAGVQQTISVTPGARYRLAVSAKTQTPDLDVAVGIDPAGGADPDAATFGSVSHSADWQQVSAEFSASGANSTIFLRCRNAKPWPVFGWCQFDGVRIEALSAGNTPPSAHATASPASGAAPLAVEFDGSQSSDPDGDALSYVWHFGDGDQAAGATASHTYVDAGSYVATLTVDDGNGGVGTARVAIEVSSGVPPAGSDRVVNGDFEDGFNDGLAQGWQRWSVAGTGYWKQSSRLGRIGSGSYASGNQVFNAVTRLNPKVVLLEGNALGMAEAIRAALPDALIIGRLFIDHLVPEYLSNPEHFGRIHAENCINQNKPMVDAWQGMNEPFLNDVESARKAARFEKAFSDRLQELGRKSVVFNIAVGNPGDMEMMLLPEIVQTLATADYAGYHAYGGIDDQLMVGPQSQWFAHRWRFYDQMYKTRGLRMPPVIYTEATTFYAWKRGHTQPGFEPFEPWQIRDDLIAFEKESRNDPWAVGMAIFLVGSSSPRWDGWEVSNEPVIYEGAGDHNRDHPADARSGLWSQQFGASGSAFTGGISQRVAVEPGATYRITSTMKLETYGPRTQVAYRVGYDPTGQMASGNADTIVWGDDVIAAESRETDIWYRSTQSFTATGERISVWIAGSQGVGLDPFRVSVDDVELRKVMP